MAFIGARSCELHAIAIQDRVFMNGAYTDPRYKAKREQAFIVAINCAQAGGTCFCVSMNTGPKATSGFDLALTEVLRERHHYFLVEVGTGEAARGDVVPSWMLVVPVEQVFDVDGIHIAAHLLSRSNHHVLCRRSF